VCFSLKWKNREKKIRMDESVASVTCVRWIPTASLQGVRFAGTYSSQPIEDEKIREDSDDASQITADTPEPTRKALPTGDDELGPEFNMDAYDDEDEHDRTHLFSVIDADLKLASAKDDHMNDEVSDSEDEDYYDIKEDDVLFVAANVEEDACTVEVYLHDTNDGGMYVHHDFMISSFPLCLEFIPSMAETKSVLAVGTFNPSIEIWELGSQDPLEPITQLGGKKKGHTGAVISMHLCPQNQTVLASGSEDKTVRIWDLTSQASVSKLNHHSEKVQGVRWHPVEAGILMSSAYDKTVVISDQRQGSSASATIKLAHDPEASIWSRHTPSLIIVSDESGLMSAYDVRKPSEALWSVEACHESPCTSITDVLGHPDILLTAGMDGRACVWNSRSGGLSKPDLVFARELGAGSLFSVASHDANPSLAVFGGSCPVLWNITDTDVVCKTFPTLPGADDPIHEHHQDDANLDDEDD
jgi:periodic tryptophan protein 1